MRWGGFTGRITGTKKEDILALGKRLDEELAKGIRSLASLSKDEKRLLLAYRHDAQARSCFL